MRKERYKPFLQADGKLSQSASDCEVDSFSKAGLRIHPASGEAGNDSTYATLEQGCGGAQRKLLVIESCGRHRACVGRVVADCGIASVWTKILPSREAFRDYCRIVLIELDGWPTPTSPALADVRSFTENGFTIIAFTDGVTGWSLRDRCLALAAGVAHLVDSGKESFEHDLRHLLERLVSAEAERAEEERKAQETMAALGIIGASRAMTEVFHTVIRISILSDLPTLLTGETGTGKELLAHALHSLDPKRRDGPFIALNCAALAPTLAESELFGYRRGAFTGADRDRRGLIRAAHGGVLFLDEIGELDLRLQAKLLRVLQENRVLSIGDEQEQAVSVRVVAATNRTLEDLVKAGLFRADLLYRLNVIRLQIPSLRERPEDIGPLTRRFVAKYAPAQGGGSLSVAPEFIEALKHLELPGNVRQLQNLVLQALVNRKQADMSLSLSDLPREVWLQLSGQKAIPQEPCDHADEGSGLQQLASREASAGNCAGPPEKWANLLEANAGNLERCLAWCERELVSVALHRSQGNQSKTARLLGITPPQRLQQSPKTSTVALVKRSAPRQVIPPLLISRIVTV